MGKPLSMEKHKIGRHNAVLLQGKAGDFLLTQHTSDYPRLHNPNVIVMCRGSVAWINEDTGETLHILRQGDTGDDLPDPKKGKYRFEALEPTYYFCVSHCCDLVHPNHETVKLDALGQITIAQGDMAIITRGVGTVNGIPVIEGQIVHASSGPTVISATSPMQFQVFK